MALESLVFVRILEGLSLLVGFTIAYFAVKAYRRSHQGTFLSLAIGFILLTVASIVEGLLFEVLGLELLDARVARSAITLGGLAIVLYSIYKT